MPLCVTCGIEKDPDQFPPGKRGCKKCRYAASYACKKRLSPEVRAAQRRASYLQQKQSGKVQETSRAYRARNAEQEKARRKAHYKANRERTLAVNRKWRDANKEKIRLDGARWFQANKMAIQARRRAHKAAYPDIAKARRRAEYLANKVRALAHWHTRRARKVEAGGSYTSEDIARIRGAQKDRCAHCRIKLIGKGHIDHIKPLSAHGSNAPSNLQLLCQPCNLRKGAKDPIEFARESGLLI